MEVDIAVAMVTVDVCEDTAMDGEKSSLNDDVKTTGNVVGDDVTTGNDISNVSRSDDVIINDVD